MDTTTKALIIGYVQKANKKLEVAEKLLKSSDYEVFSYIDKATAETAISEAKEFLK
ncbi:hypothetical protein BPIT_16480 [Candidatus Brocadia pituitae]|nr:hypothetical protein BPIT_16480 [Candidatus Brocadia pituitae]